MGRHPKINEEAYAQGRKAFAKGNTLRSMFEQAAKNDAAATDHLQREEVDNNSFSAVLGFADAFIDAVRGGKKK